MKTKQIPSHFVNSLQKDLPEDSPWVTTSSSSLQRKMKLLIRETIRKMSAYLATLSSPRREEREGGGGGWLGRGFSRVEERATRFAWPRAIKRVTHTWCTRSSCSRAFARMCSCVLSCVFLRVVQVASPLAWIVKVLNLVSHRGVNNY